MEGYKIVFRDEMGILDSTFFGLPVASFDFSDTDSEFFVRLMFAQSHPGCRILSVTYSPFSD